jgi:hypothetical protein
MIKYSIVVWCYDKMLVNMAEYVIPGQVCVWCGVNRKRKCICWYIINIYLELCTFRHEIVSKTLLFFTPSKVTLSFYVKKCDVILTGGRGHKYYFSKRFYYHLYVTVALLSRNMLYMSILNNHTSEIWLMSCILAFSTPPHPPLAARHVREEIVPCFWTYYICSAVPNTWRKTDTQSNSAFGYWNNDGVSRDGSIDQLFLGSCWSLSYSTCVTHLFSTAMWLGTFHRSTSKPVSLVRLLFLSRICALPYWIYRQECDWCSQLNTATQCCQNSKLISNIKQSLLRAWTGHEGTRRIRLADIMTICTWKW